MIVVMKADSTELDVENVTKRIEGHGLQVHLSQARNEPSSGSWDIFIPACSRRWS